jgi:hypothetical protein
VNNRRVVTQRKWSTDFPSLPRRIHKRRRKRRHPVEESDRSTTVSLGACKKKELWEYERILLHHEKSVERLPEEEWEGGSTGRGEPRSTTRATREGYTRRTLRRPQSPHLKRVQRKWEIRTLDSSPSCKQGRTAWCNQEGRTRAKE